MDARALDVDGVRFLILDMTDVGGLSKGAAEDTLSITVRVPSGNSTTPKLIEIKVVLSRFHRNNIGQRGNQLRHYVLEGNRRHRLEMEVETETDHDDPLRHHLIHPA